MAVHFLEVKSKAFNVVEGVYGSNISHSTPITQDVLLFWEYASYTTASGPLHGLDPLPGTCCPQMPTNLSHLQVFLKCLNEVSLVYLFIYFWGRAMT